MTTMIPILRDFKPILDLDFCDLYGEQMPEERITGSKIGLDLSAGSTYTRVYTVWRNGYSPERRDNQMKRWIKLIRNSVFTSPI